VTELEPEEQLLAGIILQAWHDIMIGVGADLASAYKFFMSDDSTFEWMATQIRIDPESVRERVEDECEKRLPVLLADTKQVYRKYRAADEKKRKDVRAVLVAHRTALGFLGRTVLGSEWVDPYLPTDGERMT
jgi:hypothetical protein